MGSSVKDTGVGGKRLPYVGPLLFCHHTGRIALWSRYLGGDTLNFEVSGGLPSKVGVMGFGEEITSTIQRDLGLTPDGLGHAGGVLGGY